MKKFEDDVSPFLKPILLGEGSRTISRREQRLLVGWISLITILAEWYHSKKTMISKSELLYFMRERLPPDNWTVLVGACDGLSWQKRYRYHGLRVTYGNRALGIPFDAEVNRVTFNQITTMGIGKLLFQVFSSTDARFLQSYRNSISETHMIKIWPQNSPVISLKNRKLKLPPAIMLGDDDAETVAEAFADRMKSFSANR